jgi:pyruvate dehydrogenase E1 component
MTRAPEQPALPRQRPEVHPAEAQDWRESLDGVIDHTAPRGADRLTLSVRQRARARRVDVPGPSSTDHVNTIPPAFEPTVPGDEQGAAPDSGLHPPELGPGWRTI